MSSCTSTPLYGNNFPHLTARTVLYYCILYCLLYRLYCTDIADGRYRVDKNRSRQSPAGRRMSRSTYIWHPCYIGAPAVSHERERDRHVLPLRNNNHGRPPHLMINMASEVKNTLRRGRLASIDMRYDPDISNPAQLLLGGSCWLRLSRVGFEATAAHTSSKTALDTGSTGRGVCTPSSSSKGSRRPRTACAQ